MPYMLNPRKTAIDTKRNSRERITGFNHGYVYVRTPEEIQRHENKLRARDQWQNALMPTVAHGVHHGPVFPNLRAAGVLLPIYQAHYAFARADINATNYNQGAPMSRRIIGNAAFAPERDYGTINEKYFCVHEGLSLGTLNAQLPALAGGNPGILNSGGVTVTVGSPIYVPGNGGKQYVLDRYNNMVPRFVRRAIHWTEREFIRLKHIAPVSIGPLAIPPVSRYIVFPKALSSARGPDNDSPYFHLDMSWEEASYLQLTTAGGKWQFLFSATTSEKKILGNTGEDFEAGNQYGGTIVIDLARLPRRAYARVDTPEARRSRRAVADPVNPRNPGRAAALGIQLQAGLRNPGYDLPVAPGPDDDEQYNNSIMSVFKNNEVHIAFYTEESIMLYVQPNHPPTTGVREVLGTPYLTPPPVNASDDLIAPLFTGALLHAVRRAHHNDDPNLTPRKTLADFTAAGMPVGVPPASIHLIDHFPHDYIIPPRPPRTPVDTMHDIPCSRSRLFSILNPGLLSIRAMDVAANDDVS